MATASPMPPRAVAAPPASEAATHDRMAWIGAWSANLFCLCIVLFLYARGLAPSWEGLNTDFMLVGLVFLSIHAVYRVLTVPTWRGFDALSLTSIWLVFAGIVGALISTFGNRNFNLASLKDLGAVAFVCLAPFVLLFADRIRIIAALGVLCVGFALLDAVLNILAYLDIYELANYSNRIDELGLRVRYTGLTGNSHASGLVMFLAVMILCWGYKIKRLPLVICAAIVAFLFISGYLIDARRYVVFSLIGVVLILRPMSVRFPPVLIAAVVAAIFIYATFTASNLDYGNQLRASLMIAGWRDAMQHPILGAGMTYRDQTELVPTFNSLVQAGVAESILIEFMRDFGIFFTALWLAGILLALSKPGVLQTLPGIILTLEVAELTFGGVLRGPTGSFLFYACYCFLICDLVPPHRARAGPPD